MIAHRQLLAGLALLLVACATVGRTDQLGSTSSDPTKAQASQPAHASAPLTMLIDTTSPGGKSGPISQANGPGAGRKGELEVDIAWPRAAKRRVQIIPFNTSSVRLSVASGSNVVTSELLVRQPNAAVAAADIPLDPGTYVLSAKAFSDAAGTGAAIATGSVPVQVETAQVANASIGLLAVPPAVPGAPTFSTITGSSVTVGWAPASGASSYNLLESTDQTSWYPVAEGVTSPQVDLEFLRCDSTYSFRVVAVNANVTSTGPAASMSTPGGTTNVGTPGVPVFPVVMARGLTMSWTAAAGAIGYRIWRSGYSGSWTPIAYTPAVTFTDSNLLPGHEYSYAIQADGGCSRADSPIATVSTIQVLGLTASQTSLTLNALPKTGAPAPTYVTSAPLAATVTATGGPSHGVTWSTSSPANVAVTADGTVSTTPGAAEGTYFVYATSVDDPTFTATCSVNVTIYGDVAVTVN